MDQKYYFSLQYSAIQKTILRHDRLWSMAGISALLSELNEIIMPQITHENNGQVFVAGGGKYTGIFNTWQDAENTKNMILERISINFPMLEFQYLHRIMGAGSLKEIREELIGELRRQKTEFRGYGVSFNPHVKMCAECNEYPAVEETRHEKSVCRFCSSAGQAARIDLSRIFSHSKNNQAASCLTTMEQIYGQYFNLLKQDNGIVEEDFANMKVPYNFENLADRQKNNFTDGDQGKEGQRMAVWFSDINNMNTKVPIWFDQDEESVFKIFTRVKDIFIQVTARALAKTFNRLESVHLPFRIIIAGGDDLCLAMDAGYILEFAVNMSEAFLSERNRIQNDDDDYLNPVWLNRNRRPSPDQRPIKPYSFGSSFVITDIHTPFKLIHETGEALMSEAKHLTDRMDNSINWRIMADDNSETDQIHRFEKPLFIGEIPPISEADSISWEKLSLNGYIRLLNSCSSLSFSHMYQIVKKIKESHYDAVRVETWLKGLDTSATEKSLSNILQEPCFRTKDNRLNLERITTAFELLTIKRSI